MLRLRMPEPSRPLRIAIDRARGTKGRTTCPRGGSFTGTFAHVRTIDRAAARGTSARAAAAAAKAGKTPTRSVALDIQLAPALYRITVRARTSAGRWSQPKRRFLRVLSPRA